MQEPSSPVNPPEVGVRIHESSETGLPGEPLSLTSFWPSVSRCTSRSLASSTSCIWELRARPRESLWGAERSQLPLCGRVQDSAGLGRPSPHGTSTQAWGAHFRMFPQGWGSQDNFTGPGNKETEAQRVGGVAPGDPQELAAVSTPHPVCLSKLSLRQGDPLSAASRCPTLARPWLTARAAEGSRAGGEAGWGWGAHLGLQLLLLPLYLLLHLLVELLDLAVVVSVPPGRGGGARQHPATLLSSLCQWSLTPVTLGTVTPVTAPDLDIGP